VLDLIDVATKAAAAAAELLRQHWGTTSSVSHKGAVDLVTAADREVEALVVRILRDSFPDHGIVAEEGHFDTVPGEYCWYVDPLDGTTNFAHHYPHFAVSIALAHEGIPVLGVVHDPLRDEVFTGALGEGATLNGQRIRVSTTPRLDHGLLATGFPYDRRERARFYLRPYEAFLTRSQGIRRGGSAALDLCYVAGSRLDGFWEQSLQSWDTAAGALIVSEAGGVVSDFRGQEFRLGGDEALASNGLVHEEMIQVLRESHDGQTS
jgi:myo-inositol-1(or 4)-monophosphatase